jgi:DNA invertase Pin-like site-specific DNA recombinase
MGTPRAADSLLECGSRKVETGFHDVRDRGQLRDGDVVVVWKLDRLSRSLKDLLHLMAQIEAAGQVSVRSQKRSTPPRPPGAGRMMMQMVGSFAEFDRAMIRERTSAGLAQARLEGRVGGRRRKLGDKKRREIAESVISGRHRKVIGEGTQSGQRS